MTRGITRLLSLTTVALALPGLAGLVIWRLSGVAILLPLAFLLLLLASLTLSLEIIVKREEYISHGDSWAWGYITGFQALMSGVSHLVLVLSILGAVGLWLFAGAEGLKRMFADYAGAPLLLGGVWLFTNYAGTVFGQALSTVGYTAAGRVDGILMACNALLEKSVSLLLCLAGAGCIILGGASLVSGLGPLTLLVSFF